MYQDDSSFTRAEEAGPHAAFRDVWPFALEWLLVWGQAQASCGLIV